ncbi:MAG: hypothetical protein OXU61_10710 [Gammaproteobacteria bacterium]|nr:hypothetical protein [Gammaproteobacteria bacterium]
MRWIPACAGMADICHASGVVLRAVLDFRSFYTVWQAGIQHIKRALRAPCKGAASWRRCNVRVPRSICAGFPPLFKPGASSAREWRGGGMGMAE